MGQGRPSRQPAWVVEAAGRCTGTSQQQGCDKNYEKRSNRCRRVASMKGGSRPLRTSSVWGTFRFVRSSHTSRYGYSTYERIWLPKAISPLFPHILARAASRLDC